MKAKSIITKLLPVLAATALLLLSSCTATMSKEEMHKWVNSQPLMEEFPYPPNMYQLDKPTAQEETGITIAPLMLNSNNVFKGLLKMRGHQAANSNTFLVPGLKSTANKTTQFNLTVMNSGTSSDFKSVTCSNVSDMAVENSNGTSLSIKGENTAKSDIKLNNSELICKNTSIIDKSVTEASMMKVDYLSKSVDHIGFIDVDNDKVVTLGEPFMVAYPDKKIKIGDQWEKQVYSETPQSITYYGNQQSNSTAYQIYLYTYTLLGFANVQDKRCAIIGFASDSYVFSELGTNRKSKEEIKNTVKTLSKQSVKTIQDYLNKSDFTIAAQGSTKAEGLIACDYKTGLVIESRYGAYGISGHGVAGSMSVQGIQKIQSIFQITK